MPVLNARPFLEGCLNALESQSYPKDCYEVIVVDNGSKEDITGFEAKYAHVITAFEGFPTSYAARNKGVSMARGEVLAFTDADCIPSEDWIEKGVGHLLKEPNCGLVAGKIEFVFKKNGDPNLIELYDSVSYLQQKKSVEMLKFGATANLFTFKKVFEAVGTFDGSLTSSGDMEWGRRVHEHGYKQIYAEDVRISHPAMNSMAQLRKKMIRLAGGHYIFYKQERLSLSRFILQMAIDMAHGTKNAISIFQDARLDGVKQKMLVFLIRVCLKYFSTLEKIRLRLGGKPRRE